MERAVYERERRGYWSAALPCALEKYGIPVTCVEAGALADPAMVERHTVILVARQPPGVWDESLVHRLSALAGGAVVEGPVPAVVADHLGVRDLGAADATGAFQVLAPALRAAGVAHGAIPGGVLGVGTSRPVDLDAEQRWPATPAPLSERQAVAWRQRGWDARRWSLSDPDATVLADWIASGPDHARHPGIVQRDGLIGCCAGIYAFLGQSHTIAPYEGGEHRTWPRTASLEALLLGLIDLLYARAKRTRMRLLPWPAGYSWSMHVRHDVDRPPASRHTAAIAARHRAAGVCATWYWRARHLSVAGGRPTQPHDGNAALRAVADTAGHEVALHTEGLWRGAEIERATVEAVLEQPIRGSSAHGDKTCFRFQGAPNLIWADHQRLAYTELISHAHSHPHRAALLGADGEITLTATLCLPHHASFDRSMTPGDVLPDDVTDDAERLRRAGGLLQILNHPDINTDELFALLSGLPDGERWNVTASEAVDWWARTHIAGAVRLEPRDDGAWDVAADNDVRDLQLETRDPGGALRVQTVSLVAGGRSTLA